MSNVYHVIMAGGTGSRFWPRSRRDMPKQLLKILGDESMIRITVDRLRRISPPENILIVASAELCRKIRKVIPELPPANYIVEPAGRNTAPAIGLAAVNIYFRDSEAVMGVYPADHVIFDDDKFESALQDAIQMARVKPSLVTMGIMPTYPATGYGYIQFDPDKKTEVDGVYKVITFAEKPPLDTAKKFLESGRFLWNSGMFVWKAEIILLAMKTFMPELHDSLNVIYDVIDTDKYPIVLDREWEIIKPESIDYGVLEKARNVYSLKADFRWSDMGSWKSLYDISPKDKAGNVLVGESIAIDTKRSLIFSPHHLTTVLGLKDVVVINMGDAVLVTSIGKAESVKKVVDYLESHDMISYL